MRWKKPVTRTHGLSWASDLEYAKDPKTEPKVLALLFRTYENARPGVGWPMMIALCQNPNTPRLLLGTLSNDWAEYVSLNEVLPLLLLEDSLFCKYNFSQECLELLGPMGLALAEEYRAETERGFGRLMEIPFVVDSQEARDAYGDREGEEEPSF